MDSSSDFVYDARSRTYLQHGAARQILTRLLQVDRKKLDKIIVSEETALTYGRISAKAGDSLVQTIEKSLVDKNSSSDYLMLLLDVLSAQSRFPVLLAVDDFQSLFRHSFYKNPNFENIFSYHLSIPRVILEYACGKRTFQKGALVGAISTSDPRFPTPLVLMESLGISPPQPAGSWSYRRRDYAEYTNGLESFKVPSVLSVSEAAALFQLWKSAGAIAAPADDSYFLAKYSESAGNPRDFIWKGLLASLQS